MFFLDQAKDPALLQELIREGVVPSALWDSLPQPGEGYLMDVLVANYKKVDEKAWIDWLIRKHSCTRIPAMEPPQSFIKELDRRLISRCLKADCYPLLVDKQHLFFGVGRPDHGDLPDELLKFYKKTILYRNALSPNEIRKLRDFSKQALQSV
jgi:hypothetical protein